MKKSLLLYYAGFPRIWESVNITDENPMRIEKVVNFLKDINKSKVYVVTKNIELLANILLNTFTIKQVRGYYFPDLFSATLKNDIEIYDMVFPKYVIFYGIGKEPAVNKEFAGQFLTNLMDKAQKQGSIVFIQGISKVNCQTLYKINLPLHSLTL